MAADRACCNTQANETHQESCPRPSSPSVVCTVCPNCRGSLYDGLELYDIFGSDEGTGHQTVAVVWCAPNAIQRVLQMYQRKHRQLVLRAVKMDPKIYGEQELREWEADVTREAAIAEGIQTSQKVLDSHRAKIRERWGL